MDEQYWRDRAAARGGYAAPQRTGYRKNGSRNRGGKNKFLRTPRGMAREALRYAALYFVFLFYWEFILNIAVYGNPFGRSIWTVLFLLPSALFLSAVTGLFRSAVNNRKGCLIVTFAVSIFYEVELIYFNSFGSLFSFSMTGMGGDAVANFWWCLISTIIKSIPLILLLQVPTLFILFIGRFRTMRYLLRFRGYRLRFHVVTAVAALLCWSLVVLLLPLGGKNEQSAYGAYHSDFTDTDTGSEKLGALANMLVEIKVSKFGGKSGSEQGAAGAGALVVEKKEETTAEVIETEAVAEAVIGESAVAAEVAAVPETEAAPVNKYEGKNAFEAIDFEELAKVAPTDDIRTICEYLAQQEPTSKNDHTGKFEGYNLIYICAESFSNYALDKAVTPTLRKMANNGIVLKNYYNGFKNTTTNGEYSLLAALWPDVSREARQGSAAGSMPQSADNNMMPSFGNMMNSAGYKTRGFHNYKGSYYSRNKSWPNMGIYGKFKGSGLKLSSGWPASDLEMMEKSIDDYINEDKFAVYYMTVSGHGVYTEENNIVKKNFETVKKLLKDDGRTMDDAQIGYLAANYELDQAMKYLLKRLKSAGRLDKTVIVLAADHYPYYLKKETRNKFAGYETDTDIELYESSCIIYCAGIETEKVETPACNVDILPTLMNLFNIPYDSRLYAGTDIFGDGEHVAQLYNRSFITDDVQYVMRNGKTNWGKTADSMSDEEKAAYIEKYTNLVNQRYNFSLAVEDTDFYQFVWDNCQNLPQKVDVNTFALSGDDPTETEEADDEDDKAAQMDVDG